MIEGEKVGNMLGGKKEERKREREREKEGERERGRERKKGGKVDNIEFVAHKWRRFNTA